ncbi:putative MAD2L1-binding protein-like [Apostichopus japonicus]|uniref:Putative MAD2L1-binding protein-like n=1 Tax=Stichopus japonicus TaxID=307972 RepID=A0A2G8LIV7_STIJA|nr:putative MAD2L1-binding protein-like [Apostichopus japonicus]
MRTILSKIIRRLTQLVLLVLSSRSRKLKWFKFNLAILQRENIKKGSEASKLSQLLDAVQDFCDNLDVIFSQSVSVESLWILIGPTVATPKEVFQIHFLTNHSSLEPLSTIPSTKLCSRLLHKSLVTYNALIDTNPPPITSLHILFQGQRSSNIQWFKPKHSFKVPKRGQSFTFHILSYKELSMVEEASNMAKEKDPQLHQREDFNRIGNNTSDYHREDDLIWYAAPKAIKGVRDTVLCIPKQGETWVQ